MWKEVSKFCSVCGERHSKFIFAKEHLNVGQKEAGEEVSGMVINCGTKPTFSVVSEDTMLEGNMEVDVCPLISDCERPPPNKFPNVGLVEVEGQPDDYISSEDSSMTYNDQQEEKLLVDIKATVPESSISCESSGVIDHAYQDEYDTCESYVDTGDWRVFWDEFYLRIYFYNMRTHESTWYPPPGVDYLPISNDSATASCVTADVAQEDVAQEDVAPGFFTDEIKVSDPRASKSEDHLFEDVLLYDKPTVEQACDLDMILCCTEIKSSSEEIPPRSGNQSTVDSLAFAPSEYMPVTPWNDAPVPHSISTADALDCMDDQTTSNKKKKNKKKMLRKSRAQRKIFSNGRKEIEIQGLSESCTTDMVKYWCQRYSLFSRFDDGIKMDREGWFSVTPESIARHHASRCNGGIVIDCFTGVGGNAIQIAKRSSHMIAIDIDPQKIAYAQHNAAIYEVHDRIDFIEGDFFQLAPKLKADTVFLSPPWGGPDYLKLETYNIRTMLKPHDGFLLLNTAREVASRVIVFLPRNVDHNQLAEMALSTNPPWSLEVEKNYLNGKLKAITAYFNAT